MSQKPGRIRIEDLPALFEQGRHAELEAAARQLLAAQPANGMLWKALGVALAAQGQPVQAIQAKRRSVELLPRDVEAHLNLGNALLSQDHASDAAAAFEAAARLEPGNPRIWARLSRALLACHRQDDAIACLRKVCDLQPRSADALSNLGNLQRDLYRLRDSAETYRRALALDPVHPAAATNLGSSLKDLGFLTEGELWYRRALAWHPNIAEIHSNIANLLNDIGNLREAQAEYRRALELKPSFLIGHSNLLMALNYDDALPMDLLMQEARHFGEKATAMARGPLVAPGPRPREGRPLRVGLVSGDYSNHPVGYFLEGWLPHVDPARVELHAYASLGKNDQTTQRLMQSFRSFHWIQGLDDEKAARLVQSHGIDVLVDLAGHTGYNRLGLFAWRPAPVHVTWLGYFATTGLAAMDWLLADEASIPESERAHFTERIWYLPDTRLCFGAPAEAGPVAPAPVLRNGFITFGSYQLLGKINNDVLRAWGAIFAQVPDARLRLQAPQLADPPLCEQVLVRAREAGIDPRRITMVGKQHRAEYLASHAEVDIILDTFPYTGGAKTCEALWMGVPTVTLRGKRMPARQGAALLQAAGLPEWIGEGVDDYVARAVRFARDPQALQALRMSLRDRLPSTPLFDGRLFAGRFMEAMEGLAQSLGSDPIYQARNGVPPAINGV